MIKGDDRDDLLELRYCLVVLENIAETSQEQSIRTIAAKAAAGLRSRVDAKVLEPL